MKLIMLSTKLLPHKSTEQKFLLQYLCLSLDDFFSQNLFKLGHFVILTFCSKNFQTWAF